MVICDFCHSKEAVGIYRIVISLEWLSLDEICDPTQYKKNVCGKCCNKLANILETGEIRWKKLSSKKKLRNKYIPKKKQKKMAMAV